MNRLIVTAILLLFSAFSQAGGEPVSVGTDQTCDFSDIQSAIDSGNFLNIHVTNQKIYREHLLFHDKNITLYGGYEDCNAAESNQSSITKTILSGDLDDDESGDGTVIQITGSGSVTMSRFKVTEGHFSNRSGGIAIDSFSGDVHIFNVVVSENYGNFGGGIGIHNSPAADVMFGSSVLIVNNAANLAGGGLYCNDESTVRMPDTVSGSGISVNTSNFNGGGVFLSNGCEMLFKTGIPNPAFLDFSGIAGNSASGNGGGVFIMSGARLELIPTLGNTVNISNNIADSDDSGHGHGGGAYVTGALSSLEAVNSRFVGNEAEDGGGVYVTDHATFKMQSSAKNCAVKDRCAYISGNLALSQGGAIYSSNEGSVDLVRAWVEHNRADVGTVLFANSNSNVSVNYSVFTRNGSNGSNGYLDLGVFRVHDGTFMEIFHSTVVDNYAESGVFITDITPFNINVWNSIIYDPSTGDVAPVSQQQEDDLFITCSIFHEDSGQYGDNVTVDDPQFLDRAGKDFNLDHTTSIAIDECFELTEINRDYNGAPTGFDDPNVVASGGGYDMGAYESYGADIIFKNSLDD